MSRNNNQTPQNGKSASGYKLWTSYKNNSVVMIKNCHKYNLALVGITVVGTLAFKQ